MKRRELIETIAGIMAVSACAPAALAEAGHSGTLLAINGRQLWVDDSGPRDAPALLYVHGGPGIGAFDFEHYMKGPLQGRLRLISVDQRGVLRSSPLPADTKVTVDDLIADFEAIRSALAIPRWQILGHSFGGMVALRYGLAHPQRVERLILESPAIDLASSFRWLCAAAAQSLNGRDIAAAIQAARLADPAIPFDDTFIETMDRTLGALGERRQDLYVRAAKNRDIFSRLAETAGLPEARWSQGAIPGKALLAEPSSRKPMLSSIVQWKKPLLLVRGDGDHVTSPQELGAVERAGGKIVTVPEAGHFVHVEQPVVLADLIVAGYR
ncbi:alpha/beta hydrolase [Sphingomonas yunnanensis]|uniref:alpha/beta fold hydrolase n=1 Tax=Sphingomonas yunnanensis TaxID=310400 RepID=UPI001CA66389|nr:alpha/beta hydrolase [Sphingomonas yunnanensis]MBY9062490.1 alpha/beta hydrolase [Sphingomonas yunnanensis]